MYKIIPLCFSFFLFQMSQLCAQTWTVKTEKVHVHTSIRVQAQTKSSVQVINKMKWPPFKWVIPEGSLVKKGDKVIEFGDMYVKSYLEDRAFNLKRESIQLERAELIFDRVLRDFENVIEDLRAKRKVLLSRQSRLASLPRTDDVRIAKGNFEVARGEFQAAQEQYLKDTMRAEKGYISPASLKKSKKNADLARAQEDYQRGIYGRAQLPVSAEETEIVALKIANINLEIEYKNRDLKQQEKITEIKRKAAIKRREQSQKVQDEKREELNHITLYAPEDGIVVYNSELKKIIKNGSKPRKGMALMEIADLQSVVFKGFLPNTLGSFFAQGDTVELQFNARGSEKVRGTVVALGKNPLDLAEVSAEWGRGKNTGIKVLSVEIELDTHNALFKPGVFAQATIETAKTHSGPAIALAFIRYHKGSSWVSVDGTYQKITGAALDEYFFVSSTSEVPATSWLGTTLMMEGSFPLEEKQEASKREPSAGTLSVSGELVPMDAIAIRVPRQRHYRRLIIASVIEDGTTVAKGDVVVVLGNEKIEKDIEKLRDSLVTTAEEMDSEKKTLELKERERSFMLATTQNKKKIAQLQLVLATQETTNASFLRATLQSQQATIRKEESLAQLKRIENHPKRISPQELQDAQRRVRRDTLRTEREALSLADVQTKDEVSVSSAKLSFLRASITYENTKAEYGDKVRQQQNTLNWSIKKNNKADVDLKGRLLELKALTLISPVDGVFRKALIWDGLKRSKSKEGNRVWQQLTVAKVVDNANMYVRLLVPERFYTQLKKGTELPVTIPSIREEPFKGKITHIEPFFRERPLPASQGGGFYGVKGALGETVFPINLEIKTTVALKPGAIAKVLLTTEQHDE